MSDIKIGSKVKLVNGGSHVSAESRRAEEMGMTNYSNSVAYHGALFHREGDEFTLVAKDQGAYGIEDEDGRQYLILKGGVVFLSDPAPVPLADRLELFDRVLIGNGFKFLVVTDGAGNKALLDGKAKCTVALEDIADDAAITVYERPMYTNDLFDMFFIGKLKWQSDNALKKEELNAKAIALQDELAAVQQELAALN